MIWLIGAFFVTALLYSAVGFGGGSTYNALLVLGADDVSQAPILALICNILVVSITALRFARGGLVDWRRFAPLALLSIPAAWAGGVMQVPLWLFLGLLAAALVVSAALMLFGPPLDQSARIDHSVSVDCCADDAAAACEHTAEMGGKGERGRGHVKDMLIGGALGLIAGITGIGGGIFLAPILYWRKWASARMIAGTCSLFILVNSCAGLLGQVMRMGGAEALNIAARHWALFPAVIAGALLGSLLGAKHLSAAVLQRWSAVLILYVALRLGWRFCQEIGAL